MALYLEDTDMMAGNLHWPLPRGSTGRLITIGPCTRGPRDPQSVCRPANELIEYACDTPFQFVNIIGQFSNIELLWFNCHSIDARGGTARAVGAGTPAGIKIGGANIYEDDLTYFRNISNSAMHPGRRSFAPHVVLSEANRRAIAARRPQYREPGHGCTDGEWCPIGPRYATIRGEEVHHLHRYFIPSIILRSCAIGRNHSFCQTLADRANTFVFAPQVEQHAAAPTGGSWQLHNPVYFFSPTSLYYHYYENLLNGWWRPHQNPPPWRASLSPFQQRSGQQRIATGPGRGVGRCRGQIG